MIHHMSYVACDRCGDPCEEADDAKEARALARRRGWQVKSAGTREDLCPKCKAGGATREP